MSASSMASARCRVGFCLPRWGIETPHSARAAAACTVSLPRSLTADPTVLDRVIADLEDALDTSGWQDSVWLKGELCLVLDEAGYVTVADRRLHYDTEVGLVEIR